MVAVEHLPSNLSELNDRLLNYESPKEQTRQLGTSSRS